MVRRSSGRGCSAAATALLAGVLVAGACAGPAQASRWPGSKVTYRDETGFPRQVSRAVALWNAAVSRPRLVRARPGRRAQIRIMPRTNPGGSPLQAYGYYPPDGRVFMTRAWRRPSRARPDDPYAWAEVNLAAHEIGHALGLVHVEGCRLMSGTRLPAVDRSGPCRAISRRLPTDWELCGPQRADAAALARRYGGRVRARRHFGACAPQRFSAPPAARGELAGPASPLWRFARPISRRVTVSVRNTGDWAWGRTAPGSFGRERDDVALRIVAPDPYRDCGPLDLPGSEEIRYPTGAYPRDDVTRATVPPGATGEFEVSLCGPEDAPERIVRLRLEATGPGGTRPGPTFEIVVRRDGRPRAAFTRAPDDPVAPGAPVRFTDASSAPRGVVAHTWTFGDPDSGASNTATGPSAVHSFAQPGDYQVTLTVRDAAGEEDSVTDWVRVVGLDP
jgi:hypothetical protein